MGSFAPNFSKTSKIKIIQKTFDSESALLKHMGIDHVSQKHLTFLRSPLDLLEDAKNGQNTWEIDNGGNQ